MSLNENGRFSHRRYFMRGGHPSFSPTGRIVNGVRHDVYVNRLPSRGQGLKRGNRFGVVASWSIVCFSESPPGPFCSNTRTWQSCAGNYDSETTTVITSKPLSRSINDTDCRIALLLTISTGIFHARMVRYTSETSRQNRSIDKKR